MIEYDPREVGKKVNSIKPSVKKVLEFFTIPDQKQNIVHYIQGKILECMAKKDVITAVALIDCVLGITGIDGQELNLKFIEPVAIQHNYEDFAVSFLGSCKALNYIEENN
ncbi:MULTISPECIES: hypothetical protein [unclassified Rickettsia]|uniref:hypothetical protein n=1 Tax=unclassified Rickettsia TaxID=114295 RepID=UPI003132EDD1